MRRSHPALRRIRELRRDGRRRRDEGVLLAEGIHLAEEALGAGASIETAVVSPALEEMSGGASLRERLEASRIDLVEVGDAALGSLQDARSPQPVLLVVRFRDPGAAGAVPGRPGRPLVVAAFGIQDPGNLGSMLRSADAAGATGFLAVDGADLTHPRTVRATMGSLFRLPSARVSAADAMDRLRSAGLVLVAAVPSEGTEYTAIDWMPPLALLVGGEGAGLPGEILAATSVRVRIPLHSGVESLSVGAATAVLLFEARRRRASPHDS